MPDRQLTIGDVWQPSQADDYAKLIRFGGELENSKLRNRISAMQLGEEEFKKRQRDSLMQAEGGEQAYMQKQAALQQQKIVKEQIDGGVSVIRNFKKVLGVNGLKDNWKEIEPLLPQVLHGKFSPDNFTDEGYEVKDKDGNHIGTWAENPEGGPLHFVPAPKEPASTEANYRRGLESELKMSHPDWSPDRLKFEAAKQVRKENAEQQKQKLELGINLREQVSDRRDARNIQEGFGGWEPEEKHTSFMDKMIYGKDPKFAWGDRKSYNLFQKEYYKYINDKHISPTQIAAVRADLKGKDRSVSNQRKVYDMMNGFVMNLNKQVGEVKSIYGKLPRTSTKLLNIPIRQLRKYVTGSGEEATAKSYLIEISNEIGKLSTGSAASIRELGEQAQKQWAAIHDETLSFRDLSKVLDATQQQANMRLSSSKEAMDYTIKTIENINVGGAPNAAGSNVPPFDVTISSGDSTTIDAILRKRGVKK
jgi:hypothetical protein